MIGKNTFELMDSIYGKSNNNLLKKAYFEKILQDLSENEKKVIILKYGLEDGVCKTLLEVGEQLNHTREWVRQKKLKQLKSLIIQQDKRK